MLVLDGAVAHGDDGVFVRATEEAEAHVEELCSRRGKGEEDLEAAASFAFAECGARFRLAACGGGFGGRWGGVLGVEAGYFPDEDGVFLCGTGDD